MLQSGIQPPMRQCDNACLRAAWWTLTSFAAMHCSDAQTCRADRPGMLLLLGDLDERSDAAVHGVAPTVCVASQSDETSPLEVRGEGFCG